MRLDHPPPLEYGDLAKRLTEIAVVEDQNVRELPDRPGQVLHRPRVARPELLGGDVVAALEHAHTDALLAQLGPVEADEAQNDRVAIFFDLSSRAISSVFTKRKPTGWTCAP
jgi:hypothetical protein